MEFTGLRMLTGDGGVAYFPVVDGILGDPPFSLDALRQALYVGHITSCLVCGRSWCLPESAEDGRDPNNPTQFHAKDCGLYGRQDVWDYTG